MTELSVEQKMSFYENGYIVLPGIVPIDTVNAVRRLVNRGLGHLRSKAQTAAMVARAAETSIDALSIDRIQDATLQSMRAGTDTAVMQLVAPESDLMNVIEDTLGCPVREITGAQLATNFPADPSAQINESGYSDENTPFRGWHGHLDGLWNGATSIHQDTSTPMTEDEWQAWLKEPARNGGLKSYPDHGTSISNFTALLGIPLSDQSELGSGNLGLLTGAHHDIERFFQKQREAGGPLGPEGPEWKRFDVDAPNRCGLRHYPETVRNAFRQNAAKTADGRIWPSPTFMQVKPGDAILILHATPHGASRVEGPDPRFMAYFRLTSASRPAGNESIYPEALCDNWLEWRGMHETVDGIRQRSD